MEARLRGNVCNSPAMTLSTDRPWTNTALHAIFEVYPVSMMTRGTTRMPHTTASTAAKTTRAVWFAMIHESTRTRHNTTLALAHVSTTASRPRSFKSDNRTKAKHLRPHLVDVLQHIAWHSTRMSRCASCCNVACFWQCKASERLLSYGIYFFGGGSLKHTSSTSDARSAMTSSSSATNTLGLTTTVMDTLPL